MFSDERKTIGCEEAIRRLVQYLDSELEPASASEVEAHLQACRSCYSRAEFERKLKSRLGELRNGSVDPRFESRICDLARHFSNS